MRPRRSARPRPQRAPARRRAGFTLAEMLVILAILAVLAAVMVPVLTGQLRKSDVTRVVSDLEAVQKGAEAFFADVSRYPGDLNDLVEPINGSDLDINGNTYPTGLQNKWNGPYLDKVIADDAGVPTSFGASIADDLTTPVASPTGVTYLGVQVNPIVEADFNSIDEMIDGDVNSSTGRVVFSASTLTYLAIPIVN